MDSTDKFWAYLWSLGALTVVALVTICGYVSLQNTKLYAGSTDPINLACARQANDTQMKPVCVAYFNNK